MESSVVRERERMRPTLQKEEERDLESLTARERERMRVGYRKVSPWPARNTQNIFLQKKLVHVYNVMLFESNQTMSHKNHFYQYLYIFYFQYTFLTI